MVLGERTPAEFNELPSLWQWIKDFAKFALCSSLGLIAFGEGLTWLDALVRPEGRGFGYQFFEVLAAMGALILLARWLSFVGRKQSTALGSGTRRTAR